MANPREVDVTVLVVEDASKPGGVWFELKSSFESNGELVFRNTNHPGFKVNFTIDDPKNTGCLFQARPEDAMWVQAFADGTPAPCPDRALYWDQFEAITVKQQKTILVVRNKNQFEQMFAFSLRFTKPGWPDPILYDPIGSNRNGPEAISAMVLTAGLVVVGIAAVAAFKLLAD